jgi:tetratricopeptide (TPR) repeat protein
MIADTISSSLIRLLSLIFLLLIVVPGELVFAQTRENKFGNPLEIYGEEPLLPKLDRPLSPLEKDKLRKACNDFNNQATILLNDDKEEKAFELWYRELRLRRKLGEVEEVSALGRVGNIAWSKNRKSDLQIITNRLETIEREASAKEEIDPSLLNVLARSYQQVKELDLALAANQKILANARSDRALSLDLVQAIEQQKKALKTIGELNISRFNYQNAATAYQELLAIAQEENDYIHQSIYLDRLAEIYNEATQPSNALKVKLQIADRYNREKKIRELANLKVSIANDYQLLNKPEPASQNYREAFELAWSLKDFALASESLEKLGNLYQKYRQIDAALQIYQQLTKVQQKSYNYYGLMNNFDRIGQIYLDKNNYSQALSTFQQGLEIAKNLNYQEDYFLKQITRVEQQKAEQNYPKLN